MAVQSKVAAQPPKRLTPFGYALAGALGGCFSTAVVYPLDTIKTRIQAADHDDEDSDEDKEDLSILGLIAQISKEEGLWGFYRGFGATMLNTFSMQYAYFFFYSLVRGQYMKRLAARTQTGKVASPGTAAELLLGALAGGLAQIFTIPVSVIATRQQLGSHRRHHHHHPPTYVEKAAGAATEAPEDESFLGVARAIIKEDGITGLWLGLRPGLVLTVNPAITYGMYERVKGIVLLARAVAGKGDGKLGPWLSFLLGATSKTLATVVTYPYIMAKVRIQSGTADDIPGLDGVKRKHHHPGAVDILMRVLKHEGFLGWYQGMGAQVLKAVLAQGVLFMSKERFEHWALAIMVLFWRLQHRA
ncbi:unnamed protein product [Peniophora sp. CBMAI 1063]|nr:unnamed protein product [Peniophora sp. CBMAI 1063]